MMYRPARMCSPLISKPQFFPHLSTHPAAAKSKTFPVYLTINFRARAWKLHRNVIRMSSRSLNFHRVDLHVFTKNPPLVVTCYAGTIAETQSRNNRVCAQVARNLLCIILSSLRRRFFHLQLSLLLGRDWARLKQIFFQGKLPVKCFSVRQLRSNKISLFIALSFNCFTCFHDDE